MITNLAHIIVGTTKQYIMWSPSDHTVFLNFVIKVDDAVQ